MKIFNCFRCDPTNAGDWHSPPFRYFPEFGEVTLEAVAHDTPTNRSVIIMGGGGLISPRKGFQSIRRFLGRHVCIGWGLGENWHDDKNLGYRPPHQQWFPDYLAEFDLLGLRDFSGKYHQVPCASCLHPALEEGYAIKRRVGFYIHKRIPLPTQGHDWITNDGRDIHEKIRFLGESEIVVSNSYHGVYWAMLLNRKVICVPFGSKFFGFREPLTYCSPWNLKLERLDELPSHAGYLARCRGQNLQFHSFITGHLKALRAL